MPRVRIVGCGNPDAGDDAAGLVAVDRARPLVPSDVEVVTAPTALHVLDLLEDADTVLLVDAIRTTAGAANPARSFGQRRGPTGYRWRSEAPFRRTASVSPRRSGWPPRSARSRTSCSWVSRLATCAPAEGLSPAVEAALPALVEAIVREATTGTGAA